MSEIKFACPVCGQHITCDAAKCGAQLACPTCFQNLVVPAASTDSPSKLVLTAALVSSRPAPQPAASPETAVQKPKTLGPLPAALISGIVLICAVIATFALRDRIFKRSDAKPTQNGTSAAAPDERWKADLAGVSFPETPAAGLISGREFNLTRATLEGGALTLRQGQKGTRELAVTISLSATQGAELAQQVIEVDTKRDPPLGVQFRWRDYAKQPVQKETPAGYVLRLQFGASAGERLPGKIYFCALDGRGSWVAGNFEAEISAAPPPQKGQRPRALKPPR